MRKIIDTLNGEEIKGRICWVRVIDSSPPDSIDDQEAAKATGGAGRSMATLRAQLEADEERDAIKTTSGRPAYAQGTVYVRDNSAPVKEGAWWPASLSD